MHNTLNSIRRRNQDLHHEWIFRSQTDPQLGGPRFEHNLNLAKQVIQQFGNKQFIDFLNVTGHGNHPEVIRIFWKIGQALAKAQAANDDRPLKAAPKTIGELFYPGFDGNNR